MSWGVHVETQLFVSKTKKIKLFNKPLCVNAQVFVDRVAKENVENQIEENNESIVSIEKELSMLAIARPKDVVSDELIQEGDILNDIKNKVSDLLDDYRQLIAQNSLLEIVLEDMNGAENF
ncbi:MAG: hypothetical protein WC466_05700 [Candidatus Izemoplasmatales bacterium]